MGNLLNDIFWLKRLGKRYPERLYRDNEPYSKYLDDGGVPEIEMEPKKSEVKDCPYCGGEAMMASNEKGYGYREYYVMCKMADCGARGPLVPFDKVRALEGWNSIKRKDD